MNRITHSISRTLSLTALLIVAATSHVFGLIDIEAESFVRQQARAYWWGHTPTTTVSDLPLPGSDSAVASQQWANGAPTYVNIGTLSYQSTLQGITLNITHVMDAGGFLRSTASILLVVPIDYDFDLSGSFLGTGAFAETGFLNVHIKNVDTDTMVFENNQSGLDLDVTGGSPTGFPFGTLVPGNYEFFVDCRLEGGGVNDRNTSTIATASGQVVLNLGADQPQKIDIVNPGFEDNVLGNDTSTPSINGWTILAGGSGNAGTFNPGTARFSDEAPQGSNTAFLDNRSISQLVPEVITVDTVYSLIVEVGDRKDAAYVGYEIALEAGGSAVASDSTSATPPNDGFATAVLNFVATPGHPRLNQILTVRLSGTGTQTNMDAVRLARMPVDNAIENLNQATVYASIQAAINAADPGDVIEIPPGQYCEHLDLKGKTLTLRSSSGDPNDTIITGRFIDTTQIDGATLQCVSGEPAETLIEGLTITGGNGKFISSVDRHGGGVYINSASPTFRHVIFRDNSAVRGGGMRANESQSTVEQSRFWNNQVTAFGGAIYLSQNSDLVITQTDFSGNTSSQGGGAIQNVICRMQLTDCDFTDNQADDNAGAITNDRGDLAITGCRFVNNTAGIDGGAIWETQSFAVIDGCEFTGNSSGSDGGAIYCDPASNPIITSTVFTANSSGSGGAILTRGQSSPQIAHCDFAYNWSQGSGGAVYLIDTDHPVVAYSHFLGNESVSGSGSAMVLINSGCDTVSRPHMNHCLFVGNTAGTASVINNNDCANSTFTHCVFTANNAASETDVLLVDNSDIRVHNSIFWGNDNDALPDIKVNANATAIVDYNIVDGGFVGMGNIDADPNFLSLPSDGGDGYGDDSGTGGVDESANDDFGDLHVVPVSAAIDAGTSFFTSAVDLDGNFRSIDDPDTVNSGFGPVTYVDMGAYEFQTGQPCANGLEGDVNCDGVVDYLDLSLMAGNWLATL